MRVDSCADRRSAQSKFLQTAGGMDVDDIMGGGAYTLEVSSPESALRRRDECGRF